MLKYSLIFGILFSSLWLSFTAEFSSEGMNKFSPVKLTGQESVQEIVEKLGGEKSPNYPELPLVGSSIEIGENIVKYGNSKALTGGMTMRQSKHFVCTSCHNVERESTYLNVIDPQDRLEYTAEKGIPFLQGSPLFGLVNRTSFYNDDYEKKYGDLVDPARNDIREAIQLCAVQCSQGRALKPWEIESILSYLWTIDLKLDDLIFQESEIDLLENALSNTGDKNQAIDVLKSKYLDNSPAHFIDPPDNRKMGIDSIVANPGNGQLIYDNSCLHCHQRNDYSYYRLDHEKMTFKQLKNNSRHYDERSIYQVVRYGTEPMGGKKSYMPHYPIEKMSIQQMEDLRSYIFQEATK